MTEPATSSSDVERAATESGGPASRLNELLREFATLSETERGVTRLGYTELERAAHDVYAKFMRELGLHVWSDTAGNTIAERPGTKQGLPPVVAGSHLDSVPGGGRFDGTAGVVAAMEVAFTLAEQDTRHQHPLRFVAFAAEEGARFGQGCLGSRFATGLLTDRHLQQRDDAGISLAEAMRSVGLDPAEALRSRWREVAAFVELHIEQGGLLESTGTQVGVVDLVSGSTRFSLQISGRASHSGATPMDLRADALTAAAEIVLGVESIAHEPTRRGLRATVGTLQVEPGSITTVPGQVTLTVDIRDVDSDRQRATALEIVRMASAVCERRGMPLDSSLIGDASPVVLPVWLRRVIAQVCQEAEINFRVMTSGAGHDAQAMQSIAPSAILFVPSRAGLSHVPEEWTSMSDLAVGTDLLRSCLLRIDAELARLAGIG